MLTGDVVSLNSNIKLKMTVSEVYENGLVECVWINKAHTLSEGTFFKNMLITEVLSPETVEEREARIAALLEKARKK